MWGDGTRKRGVEAKRASLRPFETAPLIIINAGVLIVSAQASLRGPLALPFPLHLSLPLFLCLPLPALFIDCTLCALFIKHTPRRRVASCHCTPHTHTHTHTLCAFVWVSQWHFSALKFIHKFVIGIQCHPPSAPPTFLHPPWPAQPVRCT